MGNKKDFSKVNNEIPLWRLGGLRWFFLIVSLLTFIFLIIEPSLIQMVWPYLIIIIFIWILEFTKDRRFYSFTMLTVLLLMFGMQFWFYLVLPTYYGYQPLTNPGLMTAYQLLGKLNLVYYPDYPVVGDTVRGYIDVCDINLENCTLFVNYTLTAYFIDDLNNQRFLLNNVSFESGQEFELPYNGKTIFLTISPINKLRYYQYIIPRKSFWHTTSLEMNRHPFWAFFGTSGTVTLIIWSFIILKKTVIFIIKNKKKQSPKYVG